MKLLSSGSGTHYVGSIYTDRTLMTPTATLNVLAATDQYLPIYEQMNERENLSTLKVLRNVDHFATTEAFGFIDAALEFLDALPT